MKALSPLSSVFLGAALAVAPSLGMAQKAPSPETTIPRHTDKGGHGNFAPPADRRLPPDPRHDIPAHPDPDHVKHVRNTKKTKDGSSGSKSNGSTSGSSEAGNSQ